MDTSEIRKQITELINNIKKQSDGIENVTDLKESAFDFFINNIKKLHELSIVLNHLKSIKETEQTLEISPPIIKEEITLKLEPKKIIIATDSVGDELPIDSIIQKTEQKDAPKEEKQNKNNLTKPSINDIKSAIGINEQFQFANELFGGSLQEYNIAIQQLNTLETLESAIDYYTNLQQLYNWDSENELVKHLLEIIDRRYN
jgi:hypothetical protein